MRMIPGSDFAGLIVLSGETKQEGLRHGRGKRRNDDAFLKCEHLRDTLVDDANDTTQA